MGKIEFSEDERVFLVDLICQNYRLCENEIAMFKMNLNKLDGNIVFPIAYKKRLEDMFSQIELIKNIAVKLKKKNNYGN